MDKLEDMVSKYNQKVDESEKLMEKLKDVTRTIQVELDDTVFYHMRMVNGKIVEVIPEQIKEPELPDVRILSDVATFEGILNKTVKPLKAYAIKKIKVKGALKDRLLLKDLLGTLKKKKAGSQK
jgi:putative sterol carrier protein